MRFIHTADWHLGRLFHGLHLTDDQRHVLDGFVQLARDAAPDVILIAGDIYDRAVPPPEAVELLDDVLSRLVLDLQIPVVLIAGNHDSPNRLNFGSRLLAGRRLYVTGTLPRDPRPVVFHDAHGKVNVFPIPYAEPAAVRHCLDCPDATDHNAAMAAILRRVRKAQAETGCDGGNGRTIVIAHAFVAGGAECESERPLSVGGAGTVDAACFDGFDYVALGHLHCPQQITSPGVQGQVRYAGSLLKYSFDEADHPKGACVVEMDAAGRCACEAVPLRPRREVRRISGTLADVLRGPQEAGGGGSRDDYLEVTLLDDGVVLDPIGRLREVYPNVMHVVRPQVQPDEAQPAAALRRPDLRRLSDLELFRSFYRHVRCAELSDAQEKAFVTVAEDLLRREREAAAAPAPVAIQGDAQASGAGEVGKAHKSRGRRTKAPAQPIGADA